MDFSTRCLKLHVGSQLEPGRQEDGALSRLYGHGQESAGYGGLGRLRL